MLIFHAIILNYEEQSSFGLISGMGKSDKDILIEIVNEPNRETIKAMKAAEAGYVTMVDSVDELFNSI